MFTKADNRHKCGMKCDADPVAYEVFLANATLATRKAFAQKIGRRIALFIRDGIAQPSTITKQHFMSMATSEKQLTTLLNVHGVPKGLQADAMSAMRVKLLEVL